MSAENYHLKWDSHLSYLNSSVATLYKNEKFADVMLYSSSSTCSSVGAEAAIPTVGISAHKFILSSCSQFFATMFETSPIASPNGILYVVLPPELSHRAIQILVQYMYSGEATVSNDILSEVLRGGELLKIRGLCRTASSTHAHAQNSTSSATNYGTNGTRSIPSSCRSTQQASSTLASDMYNSKCPSSRFSMEHQQQQFRGLGASVMPKDSPVIVKSPKIPPMALLPPSVHKNSNGGGGGISINKEVAIDPEDKCCYQPTQESLARSGSSACTGMGCRSCSMSAAIETEQLRRRQSSTSDDHLTSHHMLTERLDREHAQYHESRTHPEHCGHIEDEEVMDDRVMEFERRIRRDSSTDRGSSFYMPDPYEHSSNSSKHFSDPNRLVNSPPQAHNFLNIKQEPNDWTTSVGLDSNAAGSRHTTPPPVPASMLSPKQPLDFKMPLGAVKLEAGCTHSAEEDETTVGDYNTLTRLVCEVCKKSFDDPKVWVRHLETHASTGIDGGHSLTEASATSCGEALAKSYVPKKRRRVSQENSMDHVTLLCDICATSFETPAEWVRHMNNQHTEIELAMFNSKKDSEQQHQTKPQTNSSAPSSTSSQHKKTSSRAASLGFMEYADKVCDICNKKFSSNSNMLLHKRSHSNSSSSLLSLSNSPARQLQSNGISNREMNSATPTA